MTMKYSELGVSYEHMDPWKILCQRAALATRPALAGGSIREVAWSRGESAFLMEAPDQFYGIVEEGLGTKNLVADEMYKLTGRSYYDGIAQDLVAAIVNDLATLGVKPLCIAPHVAAGESTWFTDRRRCMDFVNGFRKACLIAGVVWGPGESPTLPEVVAPGTVELSGSCFGVVKPKRRLIVPDIQPGDRIILVESSGIHANGLTLARRIAEKLSASYLTPIDKRGTTYGQALLTPSKIYSRLVQTLIDKRIKLHYAVHVTGHGWRKLTRLSKPFAYVIQSVPKPPRIFQVIQEYGPVSDEEAYGNLNMGVGFAFFVPSSEAERVIGSSQACGFKAWAAGVVEPASRSTLEIVPKGITFNETSFRLREALV